MDKRKNLLEKLINKNIRINTVLSIILVVALFYFFLKPNSRYAILAACFAGGLINVNNGMTMWREPAKRTVGMSYLMFGVIIIALGFIIVRYI
ncbi:MAG: hypothetical protein K0S04_418 [Herbinix sp.]|jgi:hypothetical protein|nr:hypothetical protein [Herbinix sp.]